MNCNDYLEQLKNDYAVVRKLSENNDALILLLKHRSLGKRLVLRRYFQPVAAYDYLKNVSFENLPLVYDSLCLDDGQIVLEEYIDGITAAGVLENGTYTYSGARTVVYGVCNALSLLHSAGFVHRDVKPENVIISNDATVKLLDLNASRKIVPEANKDTVQMGTIGYASPEQLGLAQSDTRTDIYSVGVLLNVLLTGKHPSALLVSGRAKKIVLKCTQIDPDSRYQSADELAAAL